MQQNLRMKMQSIIGAILIMDVINFMVNQLKFHKFIINVTKQ